LVQTQFSFVSTGSSFGTDFLLKWKMYEISKMPAVLMRSRATNQYKSPFSGGMPQGAPFPIYRPHDKRENKYSDYRPKNKTPKRHIPLRIPSIISSKPHKNILADLPRKIHRI